ncbi:MAG: outer membrane protein assembly factor BamE [Gammaproteobacteria bacterium]|nr:outer membrane protein assembly factor BamE [Gammaproteobacteria bacterium]
MTFKSFFFAALCSVFLSACIKPYQPDIQQGNIINNSDLREIRYGMSKQEVLFILGTPMVIDPFNQSRWDYYYSNTDQQKDEVTKRLVTALFDGDNLVQLSGDVDLSNVQNLEPSTEDKQHGGTVITEPTQREKGFLNRMGLFKRDKD